MRGLYMGLQDLSLDWGAHAEVRFDEISKRLLANGSRGQLIEEPVAPALETCASPRGVVEVAQTLDEVSTSRVSLREIKKGWEPQEVGAANDCNEKQESYNASEQQRLLHKEEA
ncbi:hypothetical protein ACFLR0_00865 [Candidatus Bipolaricaulota bacterium]